MLGHWALFGLAVLAGAALATQAGVNATLGRGLQSPVHAALVSFAVGTLALAVAAFARRDAIASAEQVRAIPLWAWVGGFLGAFVVAMSIELAPRLGAAPFLAAIIAGQLVTALVLDHFGWLGFVERVVTWQRLAGVALVATGALLLRGT
ncbi:MAG TPA: DMT family transporter [Candidatus Thermoplasmatota archaeon]|nr:DMT family transporter [Candidatus Thermoplasmatota archaeon]